MRSTRSKKMLEMAKPVGSTNKGKIIPSKYLNLLMWGLSTCMKNWSSSRNINRSQFLKTLIIYLTVLLLTKIWRQMTRIIIGITAYKSITMLIRQVPIKLFNFINLTNNGFKMLNIFYFSEIQSEKIFGITRYGDRK